MFSMDSVQSKAPGIGEFILNTLIYAVNLHWAIDIISFIGSIFATDAKMKSAAIIMEQIPDTDDEKASPIRKQADRVDAYVKPSRSAPPSEDDNPKSSAPKLGPVAVDEKTRQALIFKASAMRLDLKKACMQVQNKKTLSSDEFQNIERFIQQHEEHLVKYPFLADTKETGLSQPTFRQLLEKLNRQLKPFVEAKKEVVEKYYPEAKALLAEIKKDEKIDSNKLRELNSLIQTHEQVLERSPHVGNVRENTDPFSFSPDYKQLISQLREKYTQFAQ